MTVELSTTGRSIYVAERGLPVARTNVLITVPEWNRIWHLAIEANLPVATFILAKVFS